MIELVISGGQTGADQGGLRAARAAGIPTGGWAPKGWHTEDGPATWLADFGLKECQEGVTASERYKYRRQRCVRDCDAAILFGDAGSNGSRGLINDCESWRRRLYIVEGGITTPNDVANWARSWRVRRLMVAGNRESSSPGIGERVERFLGRVFRILMEGRCS